MDWESEGDVAVQERPGGADLSRAVRPIRTDIQIHPAVFISCEWLPLEEESTIGEDQFFGAVAGVCPAGSRAIAVKTELFSDSFWTEFLADVTKAEGERISQLLDTEIINQTEQEILSEQLKKLRNLNSDDYESMRQQLADSMVVISHSPLEDTNFGQLIKSATMAGAGVTVGLVAAGAATGPVVFLFVSGGILTVFLSVGLSRAALKLLRL